MKSFIQVYRNDSVWDRVAPTGPLRWFQLPDHDLQRLHVATYEVHGESVDISDVQRHAQELRSVHPDCVFVHI
jgi:hypothetical protein